MRVRRLSLRTALVIGVFIGVAWPSAVAARDGQDGQDGQVVERGRTLYRELRCRICHSIAGEGNTRGPLDGVGDRLTGEQLERWLLEPAQMTEETGATRKPDMPAYPKLSDDELDALVAYMRSLAR